MKIAESGHEDAMLAPAKDALTPGPRASLAKPLNLKELIEVVESLMAVRRRP